MIQFTPTLTPTQMVELGIFGGAYFSEQAGPDVESTVDFSMFEHVDINLYKRTKYSPKVNRFKTRAGLTYKQWSDFGWFYSDDPYGWFEWYCKYHQGRRCWDDERQIKRWNEICGPNGRWRNRLYGMIYKCGGDINNEQISPRIRQTLLHWGYLTNQKDYQTFLDQLLP
jgi:hypothetical protein